MHEIRQPSASAIIPVNGLSVFNRADNKFTDNDSSEWLKTGILETEYLEYPAATFITTTTYVGDSPVGRDTVGQSVGACSGITFDGEYLWLIGSVTKRAYRFTTEGVYDNYDFQVTAQISGNTQGITYKDNSLYIVGDTEKKVFKYSMTGVYQGIFITHTGYIRSLTWDGTYFWLFDQSRQLRRYTAAGVYDNYLVNIPTQLADEPVTVSWVDDRFLIAYPINIGKIYSYSLTEGFFSIPFDMIASNNITGIAKVGEILWLSMSNGAGKYGPLYLVGIPTAKVDPNSNLPYYVRIK